MRHNAREVLETKHDAVTQVLVRVSTYQGSMLVPFFFLKKATAIYIYTQYTCTCIHIYIYTDYGHNDRIYV